MEKGFWYEREPWITRSLIYVCKENFIEDVDMLLREELDCRLIEDNSFIVIHCRKYRKVKTI